MTPKQAAEWMVLELARVRWLDQETVAHHLHMNAPDLVYINDNGNHGIDKRVLAAFNKLTPDVVWSRSERQWRQREPYDTPGKRQQD
jgi:hypothetical protein